MTYKDWVYIALHLDSASEKEIIDYISNNIPWLEINEDLHLTLIYSNKPHEKQIKRKKYQCIWKFKKFSKFWDKWESLVIEIESDDLIKKNKELSDEHSFVSDYDEYLPHISISYKWEDIDIDTLPDFNKDIEFKFIHEIIENTNEDDDSTEENKKDSEEENTDNIESNFNIF